MHVFIYSFIQKEQQCIFYFQKLLYFLFFPQQYLFVGKQINIVEILIGKSSWWPITEIMLIYA